MAQNSKKERIQQAYRYLYSIGKVHSITELADRLERKRPGVSNALNGDERYLTPSFLKHFCDVFHNISFDYLMNGEGTMLLESSETVTAPIDKQQDALTYAAIQVGMLTAKLEAALMRIEKQEKELTDRLREIDEIKNRILSPRYPTVIPDDLHQENKKVAEP